ncbi:hypothetical protein TNCV_352331 [Trichonephila clavipes]|nr:hypothetical protein TNCV_352331 [Trichonephila clavipes]
MIECMDGKPLSDKSIQDCLFNNPPPLPEKTLTRPWKNEASSPKVLKDSLDEPESALETLARERNERFKRDVCMDVIMMVEPTIPSEK